MPRAGRLTPHSAAGDPRRVRATRTPLLRGACRASPVHEAAAGLGGPALPWPSRPPRAPPVDRRLGVLMRRSPRPSFGTGRVACASALATDPHYSNPIGVHPVFGRGSAYHQYGSEEPSGPRKNSSSSDRAALFNPDNPSRRSTFNSGGALMASNRRACPSSLAHSPNVANSTLPLSRRIAHPMYFRAASSPSGFGGCPENWSSLWTAIVT